jgi:hypothetical protein
LPSYLLPQLEKLGGREAPASRGFFPPDLVALGRAVGGHGFAHFASAHITNLEKVASHSQSGAAAKGDDDRKRGKKSSH